MFTTSVLVSLAGTPCRGPIETERQARLGDVLTLGAWEEKDAGEDRRSSARDQEKSAYLVVFLWYLHILRSPQTFWSKVSYKLIDCIFFVIKS